MDWNFLLSHEEVFAGFCGFGAMSSLLFEELVFAVYFGKCRYSFDEVHEGDIFPL